MVYSTPHCVVASSFHSMTRPRADPLNYGPLVLVAPVTRSS